MLIFLFGTATNMALGQDFSEEQAFVKIFGNYDRIHKISIWKNMRFPAREELDGFFEKKIGIVSKILFQSYKESGVDKIFLVTKTIPMDVPFNCHACLPLISATVFVLDRNEWKIESQNLFLMYKGEYGELPTLELITIGQDKMGLLLEFEGHGEVHTKEVALLISYKNKIYKAHQEIVYYDNFGVCGQSVPCASYVSKLAFKDSKLDSYYDLKIKKFGTKDDELRLRTVRIDEELLFHFEHGKYIQES